MAMPRTIKRYGNRKLYDVEASAYVSLEDVAGIIRRGDTVEVLDNVTGDDITAQTLTQIVLDEGKRGRSVLPTEMLHDVLRRGGKVLDTSVEQLKHGVDELVHGSLGRISRALQGPQTQELRQLREQLSQLEETLGRLLEAQEHENGAGLEGK
jgi:polyhydroxyalkanoate synthesis repressor PhaR